MHQKVLRDAHKNVKNTPPPTQFLSYAENLQTLLTSILLILHIQISKQ